MPLYRITLASPRKPGTPVKRRVYRWGDMWGFLTGSEWVVERRTPVKGSEYLEVVERCSIHAPPPQVDDVWDEEVILMEDGSEWNGLWSLCDDANTVSKWCSRHSIACSLPPMKKSACLISD
jgi:hypothetical protein